MSTKKNLSAKDLSEKFGFDISEKELEPQIDKDSKYLNQMADLSQLIEEKQPENKGKKTPDEPAEEKAPEPSFAELFESRNKVVTHTEDAKPLPETKKNSSKLVECDDNMDFGKLFNMSSAKIEDKDKISLPDEDYQPFEMPENELDGKKNVSFHGFDDLAKAFGGRKKR